MSFSFSRVLDAQRSFQSPCTPWFSRGMLVLGCVLSVTGGVLAYNSSATKPITTEERIIQACPSQEKQETSSGMLIYVSGAVKNPGVYTLYQDSNRVYEAIAQAGGFSAQADKSYIAKTLNMVGRLKDGERVYIPLEAEAQLLAIQTQAQATQSNEQTTTQLNPNSASQQQLEQLRGIGSVRSQQVIQGRPYKDLNDFRTRSGLSNTVVDTIESQLIFSTD